MPLQKCPRCELNYILDDNKYCTVCRREIKGDARRDSMELCSICRENPALPGKDLCLFCQKEIDAVKLDGDDEAAVEDPTALDELTDVSEMEEIELDTDRDIPDGERSMIGRELSLDDVLAEEESGEDEDEQGENM
ncbi:MAG: hypothetical protein LBN04_08430 [Oscillospiraceae bacterium]|nr:hypothetical protein [Oscillospiraceae bacterium]